MQSWGLGIVLMLGIGLQLPLAKAQPGGHADLPMRPPPPPDTARTQEQLPQARDAQLPLKITFGKKTAEWTAARLAALPHETITLFDEHTKVSQTYSGVPLMALLVILGVPERPKDKQLRLYLVAEGADGYRAVYSVAEVNPEVRDSAVIVADSLNGRALVDGGPLQLVASGEKSPARWVRNLIAVRVETAQ